MDNPTSSKEADRLCRIEPPVGSHNNQLIIKLVHGNLLIDMDRFDAEFYYALGFLLVYMEEELPEKASEERHKFLPEKLLGRMRTHCDIVLGYAKELGLPQAKRTIGNLQVILSGNEVRAAEVVVLLDEIHEHIRQEIAGKYSLYIAPEKAKYCDNDKLLGEGVAERFKGTQNDIVEAGNCYAIGCNTAAVFHLMRVVEIGLRVLAKRVGIKRITGKKPHPIEYAEWGTLIDAIKAKIKTKIEALHQRNKGGQRERQLKLYSDLADRCFFLKELRNEVCHTRKPYNDQEALGMINRVKELMELLLKAAPAKKGR
jgi:hypothetical protein